MEKKLCPLCRRRVPWLLKRLDDAKDGNLVSGISRAIPGWSQEDGICLTCLELYRKFGLDRCIIITLN